jgi:hypothetical protein
MNVYQREPSLTDEKPDGALARAVCSYQRMRAFPGMKVLNVRF